MPDELQLIAKNGNACRFDFEVRFSQPDEDGTIEGRAVTFNTVDSYRTTFDPRAFAGIENRSIPMLWSPS